MNKRLFLLRHAQALPSDGISDEGRKLTPKGKADALALGVLMKKKGYHPDKILCSPAIRTRQTLEGILENLGAIDTLFPKPLYNGGADDLLRAIGQVDDNVKSLLIVAHNPGIHSLAAHLALEQSANLMNKLTAGYAPGTLTVLDCPCKSWIDLQSGQNPLHDFLEALDYNAPATPARWT